MLPVHILHGHDFANAKASTKHGPVGGALAPPCGVGVRCLIFYFRCSVLFCSEEPVAGYYFVDNPDGVLYVSDVGIFFLPAISVVFVVNGIMLSIQIIRARWPKSFARR